MGAVVEHLRRAYQRMNEPLALRHARRLIFRMSRRRRKRSTQRVLAATL